jgi:chemotaxis protein MotB
MGIIRKFERPGEEPPLPLAIKKRTKMSKDHDESNWLVSYADMMTLLCMFYVMLFSMSTVDNQKFEKVKQEVSQHFGNKYESPTEDLGKFVTQVIQENGVAKDVTITSDGISVTLAFHSTLFFGSSSAEISNEGKLIVDRIANGLRIEQEKIGKKYKIVVEGHTDSQPMASAMFPSNWELSSARATRVIRLFLENGFQASNLLAIGYADTQPVVESKNVDGSWNLDNLAKNRRVIMRVLLPDVDTIPWSSKAQITDTAATGPVVEPITETPSVREPASAAPQVVPASDPSTAPVTH